MPTITERALAATIDHAILKPELTRTDVDAELDIAAEWKVFSVCVRPSDIPHAVERLAGSGVAVGTVIGFPHGTTSTAAKVAEVRQALADGASEFDMVINIGALRSGFDDVVVADIRRGFGQPTFKHGGARVEDVLGLFYAGESAATVAAYDVEARSDLVTAAHDSLQTTPAKRRAASPSRR